MKFVIFISFGFCLLHIAEFRHVPLTNQRGRGRSRPRLLVIRPPAGSGQPNRVVVLADPRLLAPDPKNAKRTDTSRGPPVPMTASEVVAAAAVRNAVASSSLGASAVSSGSPSQSKTSSPSLSTSSASGSGSAAASPPSGTPSHSHHHHHGVETPARSTVSARHPQSSAREQQITGGRTRSLRNLIDTLRNNPRRASNELPGSNIARISDFIPRAAPPMLPSKNRFGELNIPIVIKSALRRMRKHHRRLGGGDPRRMDSSHADHRLQQSIGRTDRPSGGTDAPPSDTMHSSAFPQNQRDFPSRNRRPHVSNRQRSSQAASSRRDSPPNLGRHSLGRNGVSRNRMSEGSSASQQGAFRPSSARGSRLGSGRGSNAGSQQGRWRSMTPGNRQRGNTGSNKRRIETRPSMSRTPVVAPSNTQSITKPAVDKGNVVATVAAASANASNLSENTVAKKARTIKANITVTTKTLTPSSAPSLHTNVPATKLVSGNNAASKQQIPKVPSASHAVSSIPPSPVANGPSIPGLTKGSVASPTLTNVPVAGNPTNTKQIKAQPIQTNVDIASANATNNVTSTKKIKTKTITVTTVVKGGTAADVAAAAASQAKLAEAVAQGKAINGSELAGLTGAAIQKPKTVLKPTMPVGSITVKRQPNGISLITLSDGTGEPVVLRASGPVKIERIIKPNGKIQFIINPIKKMVTKAPVFVTRDPELEMEEMITSTVPTTTLSGEIEVPPMTEPPIESTTVKDVTTNIVMNTTTVSVTTPPNMAAKSTQKTSAAADVIADVINKTLKNTSANKTKSIIKSTPSVTIIDAKMVSKSVGIPTPAVPTTTGEAVGLKTTPFADITRPLVSTTIAPITPNSPTVIATTPGSRIHPDVFKRPRIPRPPRPRPPRVSVRIPRPPPLPDRMFGNHFRSRHNNGNVRRHVPAPSQLGSPNNRSGKRRTGSSGSKGAHRGSHSAAADVMPQYDIVTDKGTGSGKAA